MEHYLLRTLRLGNISNKLSIIFEMGVVIAVNTEAINVDKMALLISLMLRTSQTTSDVVSDLIHLKISSFNCITGD